MKTKMSLLRSVLTNNRGLSLIEMTMVMATVAFTISISGGLTGQVYTMKRKFEFTSSLNSLRDNFVKNLKDDNSWKKTFSSSVYNPGMSCLRQGAQGDCRGQGGNFTLIDHTGQPAQNYDPQSSASLGFSMDGRICTTFNVATPDVNCPIRATFSWQPVCQAAVVCRQPEVVLNMSFNFQFPAGSPYSVSNPGQYSFRISRDGNAQQYANVGCQGQRVAQGNQTTGTPTCVVGTSVSGWAPPPGFGPQFTGRLWVYQGDIQCAAPSSPPPNCSPAPTMTTNAANGATVTTRISPCATANAECWYRSPTLDGSCDDSGVTNLVAYAHFRCL